MKFSSKLIAAAALAYAALPASLAPAKPVEINASLSQSIVPTGKARKLYLRIGLTSPRIEKTHARAPLNIALVIDRSGSMSGRKIEAARNAAIMALDRLSSDDIVSVISYDDRIDVLVPATRATSLSTMKARIRGLTSRGSTAIYAGVTTGANEIRKFASSERVNRIILLSDGLANVGPNRPEQFASLGRELASEGIVVSTIGLGLKYNEDLMTTLAKAADGNHAFVQEPHDLQAFFAKEFDDAQNIVAQNIEIIIHCQEGVIPKRSLGRSARIEGNRIIYKLGQLIGGSQQTLLVELESNLTAPNAKAGIARISLAYRGNNEQQHRATTTIAANVSTDHAAAKTSYHRNIMREVTLLEARRRKDQAIRLRDKGRYKEAKKKFLDNASAITKSMSTYGFQASSALQQEQKANEDAARLKVRDRRSWNKQRKLMRQQNMNAPGASTRY